MRREVGHDLDRSWYSVAVANKWTQCFFSANFFKPSFNSGARSPSSIAHVAADVTPSLKEEGKHFFSFWVDRWCGRRKSQKIQDRHLCRQTHSSSISSEHFIMASVSVPSALFLLVVATIIVVSQGQIDSNQPTYDLGECN